MKTLGRKSCCRYGIARESGLTLMELLVTIIIAGIAFAALVPVVVQALQTGQGDRARALALSVAQDRLEKVRELGYEELTVVNLNSSDFHAGLFGQSSNGPDGTTDREFRVSYAVTEVPVSSTDTRDRVQEGHGERRLDRCSVPSQDRLALDAGLSPVCRSAHHRCAS